MPNAPTEHEYFSNKYFAKIAALVEEYKNRFQDEIMLILVAEQQATTSKVDPLKPAAEAMDVNPPKIIGAIRRQSAVMGSLRRLIEQLALSEDQPTQYYNLKCRTIEQLWQQIESLNYTICE